MKILELSSLGRIHWLDFDGTPLGRFESNTTGANSRGSLSPIALEDARRFYGIGRHDGTRA
jgi:hypothetical protein